MLEYKEYWSYTTRENDTFDGLALDFYLNENLSYVIRQANYRYRSYILLPGDIQLRIPVLPEAAKPESLPPWRR